MSVFTTIIIIAVLAIGYLMVKSLTQVSDEKVEITGENLIYPEGKPGQ